MSRIRSEKAWLACAEPDELIAQFGLKRRLDSRRWRLFGAACYRQLWAEVPPVCRAAIETVERFADGAATRDEVDAAQTAICVAAHTTDLRWPYLGCGLLCSWKGLAAEVVPHLTYDLQSRQPTPKATTAQAHTQCDMLRDLYDFAAAHFAAEWRTEAVGGLAEAIYCGFRFADMPVLADALEEAGCDSPRLLAHCRHAAPHTRGCWVLDAVLRG